MFRSIYLPIKPAFLFLSLLFLGSCKDNSVYTRAIGIDNITWFSNDKISFDVKLDKPGYHPVYLNLRHTDDYKYSNFFVRLSITNPDSSKQPKRQFEIRLAEQDGQWIGSGSGKLLAIRTLLSSTFEFKEPGIYHIELEQFMRDDPLKEISDIGLTIY